MLLVRCLAAVAAPAPVYENRGNVSNPTVDATVFLNRGLFDVFSGDQPYDTQSTLQYTNFAGAQISGSGGFRFDYVSTNGLRRAASSWVNLGSINFSSGNFSSLGFGGGLGGLFSTVPTSWLLVNASNVVNRGGLTVDANGLLRIQGATVNLSRSGLRAGEDPFAPISQGASQGLFYSNDQGVSDLYWGVGQNNTLDPAAVGPFDLAVLTGQNPNSGLHEVLDSTGFTNNVVLPRLTQATNIFAITNTVSPTNWVIQAVYVSTNSTDPEFKIDVRFGVPRDSSVPGAKMPMVQFTFEDVDTITTETYTNYVYLLDTLGSITNSVMQTNQAGQLGQKPSNFTVTRVTPDEWSAGTGTNVIYSPDLIYNAGYGSPTVTNWYSAYSAQIGTSTGSGTLGGFFFGGSIPQASHPTNLPARIEVDAGRLDLGLARFRSEGLLSIKSSELVGSAPYKLDATTVNMDVGLPQGSLNVSNLIQPIVRRFNGTIAAWSAVWTNQAFSVEPDPATPGSSITNTIEVRCHALIVDHQFITRVPVQTYRFAARAPQVVLRDSIAVVEGFTIDAPNVDLWGSVQALTNPITEASFPSLVNLTNRALLSSSVGLALGTSERPVSYVENSGLMYGATVEFNVTSLNHSGVVFTTVGDLLISGRDIKIDQGRIQANANLVIKADDLKVTSATFQAGYEQPNGNTGITNYFIGALSLDITTRLTDGGMALSNLWTVYDGFRMVRKPAQGDLLGTVITSKVGRFAEAIHTWAGEDLGPVAAGYQDNAALGRLVLDGRSFSLFTFASSTGQKAALYVDYLEFANYASNLNEALNIAPEFTLYFADSNLPADQLDGLFDGRVRWVQDYAGPISGTPVTLSSGRTVFMNRALVLSSIQDSDGDGVVNSLDPAPFEASALRINVRLLSAPVRAAEISWAGTPGARYSVEYVDGLESQNWKALTTVENQAETPGTVSVLDTPDDSAQPRFYRVVEDR